MNLKTIITALVLGSSTVGLAATASAAPRTEQRVQVQRTERHVETRPVAVRDRDDRDHDARDHREPIRYERPIVRPIVRPIIERPIYETTYAPAPIATPFVDGQMYLGLGGVAGNGVELTWNGGSTWVQQVALQYADGHTQLVAVSQSLDARNPTIQLASDGCPLSGVVIYGQGAGVSALAI